MSTDSKDEETATLISDTSDDSSESIPKEKQPEKKEEKTNDDIPWETNTEEDADSEW